MNFKIIYNVLLSWDFKEDMGGADLRDCGNLFHSVGAAKEKLSYFCSCWMIGYQPQVQQQQQQPQQVLQQVPEQVQGGGVGSLRVASLCSSRCSPRARHSWRNYHLQQERDKENECCFRPRFCTVRL